MQEGPDVEASQEMHGRMIPGASSSRGRLDFTFVNGKTFYYKPTGYFRHPHQFSDRDMRSFGCAAFPTCELAPP